MIFHNFLKMSQGLLASIVVLEPHLVIAFRSVWPLFDVSIV